MTTRNRLKKQMSSAFSLVEVTIALGLVSYTLIALLGLFVVGLNASRESSRETALAQIAMHARSSYDPTNSAAIQYYDNEGQSISPTDLNNRFFKVTYREDNNSITNTASNLTLLTLVVESMQGARTTNQIQTSVFVP